MPNKTHYLLVLLLSLSVLNAEGNFNLPVPKLQVPKCKELITIDGHCEEKAWAGAAKIEGLSPIFLSKNQDVIDSMPTIIKVLWDEAFLYVSFQCTDKEVYFDPADQKDELLYKHDVCEVFIDGKGDGKQYIEIQVNPKGVNLDLMYLYTQDIVNTDEMRITQEICDTDRWKFIEWNCEGLETASQITDNGWTVEMKIPAEPIIKRLGLQGFAPAEIRANFMRYDYLKDEKKDQRKMIQMNWSPVKAGCPHISPARMGVLQLVDEL